MEENQFHSGQTSIHYHPLGFSARLFFNILGILNLIHQLYSKYYPLCYINKQRDMVSLIFVGKCKLCILGGAADCLGIS